MLQQIFKFSPAQYNTLQSNGSITISGTTYTLNSTTHALTVGSTTYSSDQYIFNIDDEYAQTADINKLFEGSTPSDFMSQLVNLIYPVGSIYTSVNNTSPQGWLGGSWTALGKHYLVKGDIPVRYKGGVVAGVDAAMHFIDVVNGNDHPNSVLGLDTNSKTAYGSSFSASGYNVAPDNGWGFVTSSNQSSAVYLFQRIS